VREIARQHGAEIEIFNNPRSTNKKYPGSLFRLTFPPTVTPVPDADRDRPFL
jgi:two-component system sensor histidine kinase TctE